MSSNSCVPVSVNKTGPMTFSHDILTKPGVKIVVCHKQQGQYTSTRKGFRVLKK